MVTKSGTLGSLTVASAAGAKEGDTAITVTETALAGTTYKYKTDTSVDLPALDDDLSAWADWDGTAEITAKDGDEIVIAEVNYKGLAKSAGKATVDSTAL